MLQFLNNILSKTKGWKRAGILIWASAPRWTIAWFCLLLIQGILPGFSVLITKYVIDSFVAAKNSGGDWAHVNNALIGIVIFAVILLSTEILQHINEWVRIAQAENVTDYIKDKIHSQSAELDIAYYDSPEYHNLMEQAKGESSSKPLAVLENLGAVLQNTITLLAMGVILINYGWWLPFVLLFGTLPALYIALKFDRIYFKWWKSSAVDRRWLTYFDTMLTHSEAAAEMRLFNLSDKFREQFQNLRHQLREKKLLHIRQQNFGKFIASVIALMTVASAMSWMGYRALYGNATLGDLAVFYQVFSKGQSLMRTVLGSISQTINNTLYLESLFEFFDLKSKIISPENPIPVPQKVQKGINFRDVTFYYPDSLQPAIKNFNLFIPTGQIVALVGVNGAGKSTLIKLLGRFYDPAEGTIEIDDINLKQFNLKELRKMVSVLFQSPIQFHATAAGNITLGDTQKGLKQSEIEMAAQNAGAHDFISRLPKQYNTLLGKWFVSGSELSGGEWQRIALARAYFRRSSIVVLDEPTSFMDSWAEVDWFDRFREMVKNRTSIIITHRFTMAMRADIIHVIDQGKIIESGSHKQLLEIDGFYAKSWKSQMQVANEQILVSNK